ncbi:hypothetical protein GGF43_004516, partial [Coemansia sp. RSA 2618]
TDSEEERMDDSMDTSSTEEDEDDVTFAVRRPVGRPPKYAGAKRGQHGAVRRARGGRPGRPRGSGRGGRRGRPPKWTAALRAGSAELPEPARRLRSQDGPPPFPALRAQSQSQMETYGRATRRSSARQGSAFGASLVENMAPAQLVEEVERVLYDGKRAPGSSEVRHHRDVPWCPFTVEDLSALLRVGEQLYFSSPEFEALIEWELAALEAERQAQAAAGQADAAIRRQAAGVADEQQEAYRRQAAGAAGALRSVGLFFPLLGEMERVERSLDWCADVRERLQQRTLTSEVLDRLVDQAARLGIDEQLEPVVRLAAVKQDVDDWARAADEIIGSRQAMDLRDVAKLLEKGRNMDVAPANYPALRDMQQTALDLQARTDKIVERTESGDLVQRPHYGEAVELAGDCTAFGRFEPSGFDRLRAALAKADAWGAEIMGMFVPVLDPRAAPQDQLDAQLEAVQYRLRRALALARPAEQADAQGMQPPATPSADMYCVCLQPEEGLMIECEGCREWYHAQCLNLSPGDIAERQFLCPLCVAASKGERVQLLEDYPALGRVGRVVEEGRKLALVAHTLDPLVTVLLDARALVPAIQRVLENTGIVGTRPRSMSVDTPAADPAAERSKGRALLLRALIRALLGLGVNLKQGLLEGLWAELQGLAGGPAPETVAAPVVAVSRKEAVERQQHQIQQQHLQQQQQQHEIQQMGPQEAPAAVLDEFYQQQLEELVYLIVNPPAADSGQGLPAASSTFKENDENCVCNVYGVDLADAGMADEAVVLCDACHEHFHINCVQVPPPAARIVLLRQMQRSLNADIDADVPDEPNTYVCPGCCVKMGTPYPYGEVVFEG